MDRGQTGVRPRGNSIVIGFMYKGQRCRETLRVKPTRTALKEATRKREAILYEIAMGKFDYASHFPNSKHALTFSSNKGALITIEQALKDWLKRVEKRCQYSTIRDYNSAVYHHLIPTFGSLTLDDFSVDHIHQWLDEVAISHKRINNVLSPLRQIFKDAFYEGLIDRNPMDRFRNLPISTREPKPFALEEIDAILSRLDGQERNLIQFAFWTGLRTSELIGLRWEDFDPSNKRVYVRTAVVRNKEKGTKTSSGHRTVELQPNALTAIEAQQPYTSDDLRVFHDPKNGVPWHDDQAIRKRVWKPALLAAGIEYRSPYQTRHTFASMMLSAGKNPLWVAQQMGHKDWGMIRKVYGRWIATG
ncbi:site-specific integrase [Motiliproteus coralliicola]|uniref:Site-specific integrase n=1 Tax=Motiliproteus coralliicola TaxID=2283196 RepID=A0A369WCR6_9GAMM|nr:site-specific integrase [Motiliproteus coralliicola]RDE18969.1 site-specific integrase [Motiliproteus coralliicola]